MIVSTTGIGMTLQTTRIDTLYSPVQHGGSTSQNHPSQIAEQQQEILLVDFVPNGPNSGTTVNSPIPSSGTMVPSRFNSHPVQIQALSMPIHASHNHNPVVNHNNNDLSNYTLVNLSNQLEPDEYDENYDAEESQIFFKDHIPLKTKRTSITGCGGNAACGKNIKGSSSITSSTTTDDSDTGFLVPHNGIKGKSLGKDKQYKLQSSVPPSTSYPGSPGFISVQQAHRKRLRRRRSSGRRVAHNQPKNNESNDLVSLCCCFGDDDSSQSHSPTGQNPSNSLANRYIRYSCVIVMIIAFATLASIMVSLQRKVDSLSWEVKKYSSTDTQGSTPARDKASPIKSLSEMQEVVAKQEQLNASYSSLKTVLEELNQRVITLEKQTQGLPPSVEEVRKDLATLGSELEGSIKEMQKDLQDFKNANAKTEDNQKEKESPLGSNEGVGAGPVDAAATTSSSGG